MFGKLELDDETFEEIFEYYKRKIPQIYNNWTDFNEHDPGITFLELLSWMKEMQQFHLDQIGLENYRMFLKLIGMKQRKKEPVCTYAVLSEIERDFFLPKNSRIYAGEILFETVEERHFSPNRLLSISSDIEGKRGMEAKVNLLFEHSFSKEEIHRLYFKIAEPKEGKRQPVGKGFLPLIQWKLEAVKNGNKIPCRILKDETYGLLFSGEIQFVICGDLGEKTQPKTQKEDSMSLCFTIEDGEYDIPPSILAIEWNSVMIQQTETRSTYESVSVLEDGKTVHLNSRLAYHGVMEFYKEEKGIWYLIETEKKEIVPDGVLVYLKEEVKKKEILYTVMYDADFETERYFEMDGFPFQKIRLEHTKLLQDQMEIIVEHPFQKGCFERYQRVENFYYSKPEDRHFVFDEEQGCLYFGDCERGMAPKGILKIIRYISSEGLKGNIKEHQLKIFEDRTIPAKVSNYENTFSGADKESIEECFLRFIRECGQTERAITTEDYENLVLQTPGLLIHKAKATIVFQAGDWERQTMGQTVSIVVKPHSDKPMPKLSNGYERNIRRMLEEKRMLGTRIQILSPEYIGIYLFAEIICKAHYRDAKERIREAVEQYFQEELMDFGKTLVYGKLYRVIESLTCVDSIRNLSLHAQGKGVLRSPNGDYKMPGNALIYLKSADYYVTSLK